MALTMNHNTHILCLGHSEYFSLVIFFHFTDYNLDYSLFYAQP